MLKPEIIQRQYYEKTASKYDEMHTFTDAEHTLALHLMLSVIKYLDIKSILDIGSGTGRAIEFIKNNSNNEIKIIGIEPSEALRNQGYQNGLHKDDLIDGDAQCLKYNDGEFDLACAFAALHHIPDPKKAVSEMLRVSRKAIFISDSNNFGQGNSMSRFIKQMINSLGMWKYFVLLKTGGKGYSISEGDGLSYSYSVFNNYDLIKKTCSSVHIMNTTKGDINPYRSSSHIALLGVK
jgi:ubiquinone/menaquinone biosynthesis C-methylase UbiE